LFNIPIEWLVFDAYGWNVFRASLFSQGLPDPVNALRDPQVLAKNAEVVAELLPCAEDAPDSRYCMLWVDNTYLHESRCPVECRMGIGLGGGPWRLYEKDDVKDYSFLPCDREYDMSKIPFANEAQLMLLWDLSSTSPAFPLDETPVSTSAGYTPSSTDGMDHYGRWEKAHVVGHAMRHGGRRVRLIGMDNHENLGMQFFFRQIAKRLPGIS
jgi:hypothetical protein